jgi:hypothetical protein
MLDIFTKSLVRGAGSRVGRWLGDLIVKVGLIAAFYLFFSAGFRAVGLDGLLHFLK